MIKKNFKKSRGLTLVEILVAVSLFSTVGLMALTVFINITRIQGRLALENAIYEDARFMMERISRAIRNNAIDYEEYFNKGVSPTNEYGKLYGCYAAQFYNPGQGVAAGVEVPGTGKLGAQCSDGSLYNGQECVVFKPSIDINTGMYPYRGASMPVPIDSTAFCPQYLNGPLASCTVSTSATKPELYLINKDGTVKTFFAKKIVKKIPSNDEFALAMFEKMSVDKNSDGINETWKGCALDNPLCCTSEYDCKDLVTLESSLTSGDVYKGFVPLSPLRSNVTKLEFQIMPTEDPRKAFAEPSYISQPRVRITLSVQPSAAQLNRFGNPPKADIPTIVLQTTVSSRIQSEVKSYLGPDTYAMGAACQLTN